MRLMRAGGLGARILGMSTDRGRHEPTRANSVDYPIGPRPIEFHADDEHAKRLVRWCYEGQEPLAYQGEVLARDLMGAYLDMIADVGWVQRPWNRVGAELRILLNGGRKIYSGARRERVYRFGPDSRG